MKKSNIRVNTCSCRDKLHGQFSVVLYVSYMTWITIIFMQFLYDSQAYKIISFSWANALSSEAVSFSS